MAAFRPYTNDELRKAAAAYGIDPDFVEAVYEVESSRGTNPRAMTARTVKRKRDSTIVRGPFQLEDGTTADIIRKHKLGAVNIDDPDVHLDLALRHMRDLQQRYNGDYGKMAQAYLGFGTDELGTTDTAYRNKIVMAMDKLKGSRGEEPTASPVFDVFATREMPPVQDFDTSSASTNLAAVDEFGIPASMPSIDPNRASWTDMVRANNENEFSGPVRPNPQRDMTQYLSQLVDEELTGRDFINA